MILPCYPACFLSRHWWLRHCKMNAPRALKNCDFWKSRLWTCTQIKRATSTSGKWSVAGWEFSFYVNLYVNHTKLPTICQSSFTVLPNSSMQVGSWMRIYHQLDCSVYIVCLACQEWSNKAIWKLHCLYTALMWL